MPPVSLFTDLKDYFCRVKISASIYSGARAQLRENILKLEKAGIDLLHIDCMDDMAVFTDLEEIRTYSSLPFDLHLITSQPEKYTALIEKIRPEFLTYQLEDLPAGFVPQRINGTRLGLALVSGTPLETLEPYIQQLDHILLMTTTPGKSGGTFDRNNFRKIRQAARKFRGKTIHVDGGVNHEISFILRNLGVHVAVSGSFLMNNEYFGEAMMHLKHQNISSHFTVADMMLDLEDLPVLDPAHSTLHDVLVAIDRYALGFALLAEPSGKFRGLISNADIRKALIRFPGKWDAITVQEVVNPSPVSVQPQDTIEQMLKIANSKDFLITFMPVTDAAGTLHGAVTFNQLIKGEA